MRLAKHLMQAQLLSLLVLSLGAIAHAGPLTSRADTFVCDLNGSAAGCTAADAGRCIEALKGEFSQSGNNYSFTSNYGAYVGGCRCYAECRTGQNYPTCIVSKSRVEAILYGLRDTCISSAAHALGYVYADNAKWEFALK